MGFRLELVNSQRSRHRGTSLLVYGEPAVCLSSRANCKGICSSVGVILPTIRPSTAFVKDRRC